MSARFLYKPPTARGHNFRWSAPQTTNTPADAEFISIPLFMPTTSPSSSPALLFPQPHPQLPPPLPSSLRPFPPSNRRLTDLKLACSSLTHIAADNSDADSCLPRGVRVKAWPQGQHQMAKDYPDEPATAVQVNSLKMSVFLVVRTCLTGTGSTTS
ncbi:hypothetical protein BD779DRAFT_1541782, partial [Infundibulicybe gibba]